ncbi:hypothetical protein CF327_g2083 [Tilletia walkeri]|nr:hypothetical protein CF327_g2083 [Tilletia walkeri]
MSDDDRYTIFPLVELSQAQRVRLDEGIQDARENDENLNYVEYTLQQFYPGYAGKDLKGLVDLSLTQPDDEESGGKKLAEFFSKGYCHFLFIDERSAQALTDDAEEGFSVFASEYHHNSLKSYLGEYVFEFLDDDDEDYVYLQEHPPAESSDARLRLKSTVERLAKQRVERCYGVDWADYVTFRWNVDDVDAILTRKEGKDAEVLEEIKYIRMTAVRSDMISAGGTLMASSVKDPLDMFAYAASRATKDRRGIATEEIQE